MDMRGGKGGRHKLIEGCERPAGSWRSRLLTPLFQPILNRIDAGLAQGRIEADLPDGTHRILGARGPGPVAEIRLNSWMALVRLVQGGSAGWYRAWEAGDWESPDPVPIFDLFMRNRKGLGNTARAEGPLKWIGRLRHALRRNDRRRARRNILFHYDLGNDFYREWLDPTMSYSSAIFTSPDSDLETAQREKVARIIARMEVAPGNRTLEIGCGWGFLSGTLAREHGALATGISLSDEQTRWAREHHHQADFRIQDYRDVDEQFDAIASVEMVEAVGQEYWGDFLDAIARNLKPGGRAALQYIAIADDIFERYAASADFIQTYIFPGGMLLSESRFRALAVARGLAWCDRVGFGQDYARTLKLWRERFDRAVAAGRIGAGFNEKFLRLWRYYLMYCEGGFRGGGIDVAQVTLVKDGSSLLR